MWRSEMGCSGGPLHGALMQSVLFSLTDAKPGYLKTWPLLPDVACSAEVWCPPCSFGRLKDTLFPHAVLWLHKQSHSPANVPQPGLQKPACGTTYIWEGLVVKAALGTSKTTRLRSETLPNIMNVRWDKYTVRHDILPAPSQRIIENTKLPSKDIYFVMW